MKPTNKTTTELAAEILIKSPGMDALEALRIATHQTRYDRIAKEYHRVVGSFSGVDDCVDRQWKKHKLDCIAKGIKPTPYPTWVSQEWKGGEA